MPQHNQDALPGMIACGVSNGLCHFRRAIGRFYRRTQRPGRNQTIEQDTAVHMHHALGICAHLIHGRMSQRFRAGRKRPPACQAILRNGPVLHQAVSFRAEFPHAAGSRSADHKLRAKTQRQIAEARPVRALPDQPGIKKLRAQGIKLCQSGTIRRGGNIVPSTVLDVAILSEVPRTGICARNHMYSRHAEHLPACSG